MTDDSFLRRWFEPVIYGTVAILLWMVPVFDRLHVESAAVLTLTAYFVAGVAVIRRNPGRGYRRRSAFKNALQWSRILFGRIAWLLVPAGLLTLSAAWAPNCDWIRGAGLFFLFSVPTVVFSAGLAAFLSARVVRPTRWLVGTGILLAILGPIFDIGLHPQFYTYSTVFGGILGPIYDEELVVRPGLFVHRVLTIAWGLFFFASRVRFTQWSLLLVLLIGGAYVASGPLGINTPTAYLRSTFDGHVRTEHFDVHYDTSTTDSLDLVRITEEHEFRYAQLSRALDVDVAGRITTFIYPDAETRARHTGARVTSVAPVWLRTPQIHVESRTFNRVFPHELVHVFSREFGLPVLNASVNVGLVEGLAVALEPPSGGPTPDEQVASAAWAAMRDGGGEFMVADQVESALSAAGFWGGRGAVSYTTTGSFVGFLLDVYGPEALKEVYPLGDFKSAYGADLETLTGQWQERLLSLSVLCRSAGPTAQRRFSVPSLFERRCPHWVPPEIRTLREAASAARDDWPDEAMEHLERLPEEVRRTGSVRMFEADLLIDSDPEAGLRLLSDSLTQASPRAAALAGDAFALLGRADEARERYAESISRESPDARSERVTRILRYVLADFPEAVRKIRSSGAEYSDSATVRLQGTEGMRPLTDLELRAIRITDALRLYSHGKFEGVLERLDSMNHSGTNLWPTGEAERFAVRLQALAAYRAGRLVQAEVFARRAESLYAGAGDAPMAAVLSDFLERIEWATARTRLPG